MVSTSAVVTAIRTAQQADLIDYFQSRGVYVVGAGRHSQSSEQIANAGLHDAYIPWQGYWNGGNSYSPAETVLDGVTVHIPHVFPGFSWTHLKNSSTATSRDREDGDFYWRMLSDAVNETDAPWLFIGMFDEYDEGTNLIPASDDPPVPDTDSDGIPLTYQVSDPRPNDWWMALTGAAKQALQGKTAINDTSPTESDLENRPNIGGEVWWRADDNERLTSVGTTDSQVEIAEFTVESDIFQAIYSFDPYLYFQVDDRFLQQESNGRDVTIEVEYLDSAVGQFNVEYDSLAATHMASEPAQLTGSGEWRTHRFEIADAHFGNSQGADSDFRFVKADGELYVRRVSVLKESMLTVDVDFGLANEVNGLNQVEVTGDGQTIAAVVDDRGVRQLTGAANSQYVYMQVDDGFASEVQAGLNAIVEVVYRDSGSGSLNIQYDSTSSAYQPSTPVEIDNTGEWRTARFHLDDALFANRQNGGADFRVSGSNIPIDQIRVLRAFGDLMAPELQAVSAVPSDAQNKVTVAWSMIDDWTTGVMDQWTKPEDGHVAVDWTSDGGLSWEAASVIYEGLSGTSQISYNVSRGETTWSDEYVWDVSGLPAGTYQLRLTPTDGRGNLGEPVATSEFQLTPPPALPGDYNLDGAVNLADYTVWRDQQGSTVDPYSHADGNGSGMVGAGDYGVWKSNFGNALSMVAAEFVHEAIAAASTSSTAREMSTQVGRVSTLRSASGLAAVDTAYSSPNSLFNTDSPDDFSSAIDSGLRNSASDNLLLLLATDRLQADAALTSANTESKQHDKEIADQQTSHTLEIQLGRL